MSAGNTQNRAGTERLKVPNRKGRGGPNDGTGPLRGDLGGNRLTSHNTGKVPGGGRGGRKGGGREIFGQELRGFVKSVQQRGASVKDVTVADDGTRRVQQISGPGTKSGPSKPSGRAGRGGD